LLNRGCSCAEESNHKKAIEARIDEHEWTPPG
jgi:hypothetical protein